MASTRMYREIYGLVEEMKGSIILTRTAEHDFYKDVELDLKTVMHNFDIKRGDRIKLCVECTDPPKVFQIEPETEFQAHIGEITGITKKFGVVDDCIVFFMNKKNQDEFHKGDKVDCILIDGEYFGGKFQIRCESIRKIGTMQNDHMFADETDNPYYGHCDSDIYIPNDSKDMKMDGLPPQQPKDMYFDLPVGLFEAIQSKDRNRINNRLKSLVPMDLNYETYRTRFHALIFLEEIEMKKSFEQYKSSALWIQRDERGFSIPCTKIKQLRPPISIGDKIEVRKHSNPRRFYRGLIERVLEDRFILRFRRDFMENYNSADIYQGEFTYSRTVFMRKHAAIDYAKKKLPAEFLFPNKMQVANTLQLNVELIDEKLMLNQKQIPWFQSELNIEQKQTVVNSLRGECRPLPYVIFGPPGTGKTSTLVELVLQIYTNVEDARILIATQSNTAANVVASRLVKINPDICTKMLRLVSNAVLDKNSLPNDLHKYSASIRNKDVDENLLIDATECTENGIGKNRNLEYVRDFKIVIGTCVGLGVINGSEFSDGYFTHVLIDEAAQCNESEAMLPISFINIEHGQVILAGDCNQLPPITLSSHAKHFDFDKSAMERYLDAYKHMEGVDPSENGFDTRLVSKLRRNYRSLPSILNFYNDQFYDSQLIGTVCGETSDEANKLRHLSSILPVFSTKQEEIPFGLFFINVHGINDRLENRKSWSNQQEVDVIVELLPKLIEKEIALDDIGIISPYHAQVMKIKKELISRNMKKIRVGTVEEFQGAEKNVILFSAVKTSGLPKALQFIFCPKRMNSAISRARMLVIVIGKADLLEKDENWGELIGYCKHNESFLDGIEFLEKL